MNETNESNPLAGWELTDRVSMAFSKPVSRVCAHVADAIRQAAEKCSRSDRVLQWVGHGWQVWAKRANARGVRFPGDYELLVNGRRARKHRTGSGRCLIVVP